ncbi:MAG: hypothetical protein GDA43_01680 [Hormoscilla sp. SP5CHS1]|nr:hypothetical protein [Hormoscilla sp. SP5CHS1]
MLPVAPFAGKYLWLRGSEHAVASYTSPETRFFHKSGFLHAFLRCSRGTLLMAIATCWHRCIQAASMPGYPYDSQLSPAGTGVLDDALASCEVIARSLRGYCSQSPPAGTGVYRLLPREVIARSRHLLAPVDHRDDLPTKG